jgi:hypothetical protein
MEISTSSYILLIIVCVLAGMGLGYVWRSLCKESAEASEYHYNGEETNEEKEQEA